MLVDATNTSQSVDRPLLKLLKRDFGGRGNLVNIQSVGVFLLFVRWGCELLFLVIESTPSLRINSSVVLPNHFWVEMVY